MVTTIHPVDATAGAPSYSGRMLRQVGSVAFAGASAGDPFGARSGVRPGTGTIVYADATSWSVGPHAGVLDFETAMESGPTSYAIGASTGGALRAADAFARVDLVWVRQDIPLEDGSAVPAAVPGYTYGTVAGTPPTTPARCMVLAWINVPASGGGSPTVTWKAPYAVAAGVPDPAVVTQSTATLGPDFTVDTAIITAPAVTGDGVKRFKITGKSSLTQFSVSGDLFDYKLKCDSTAVAAYRVIVASTSYQSTPPLTVSHVPAAGSHVYSLWLVRAAGTGTATITPSGLAGDVNEIIVEQIA